MIVYKTTNKINGKIYIGQYSGSDSNYLGSGHLIIRAIAKYGHHNFVRETLEEVETRDELNTREIYWIEHHRKLNVEMYNIASGGHYGDTFTNNPNKEEIRAKLRNASTGKKTSEDTKKKLSEAQLGNKHWNYGRQLSEDTKNKISKAKTGMTHTLETKSKMSSSKSGKNNPRFGEIVSEDTKNKISKALVGKNIGNKSSRARQITIFGISFPDAYYASSILNESRNTIAYRCSSKTNKNYAYL